MKMSWPVDREPGIQSRGENNQVRTTSSGAK